MNKRNIIIAITAVILILAIAVTALILSGNKAEPPPTVAELLDLGEKYLLDMDYEQAIVQFNRVIEIEPLNPRGYTGAAEAYIALGEVDKAIEVLQRGAALLPDDAGIAALLAGLTNVYEEGSIVTFGGYEWRVLEVSGGKALLLAEYVVEHRAYHDEFADTTWAECALRGYLNGEFLERFDEGERARVAETRVVNDNNPWKKTMAAGIVVYGDTPGGEDTTDRVFLLSLAEVARYFGDSGQLAITPDTMSELLQDFIDDEYNGARVAYDLEDGAASWWWLRSPGGVWSLAAAYVHDDGRLDIGGAAVYGGGDTDEEGRVIHSEDGGVRPALWLILE
ncbi:MAG: tetratricopeptide repeat protein [Lachnospiraceae bacterium]|jgi:tetratricopeptide (TPR) repeat protein|nr:tetratricopeptide repeat protein [Lachnospiraceae bacterium]